MLKSWNFTILFISCLFLASIKAYETRTLVGFYHYRPPLKISYLQKTKQTLDHQDQISFSIWESIITGNTKGIPKPLKEEFLQLGLAHLFSPSGFHLSSVLSPIKLLSKNKYFTLIILIVMYLFLLNIPSLPALKRMNLIKIAQYPFGKKTGFVFAIIIDCMFGTMNGSPIGFTLSFLYLGLIYSGMDRWKLILYLFFAQMLLGYFLNISVHPFNLFMSPILNLCAGLIMPLLFLLIIPLWEWQLQLGLSLISGFTFLVKLFIKIQSFIPSWEIHIISLLLWVLFIQRQKKWLLVFLFIFTGTLHNDEPTRITKSAATYLVIGNRNIKCKSVLNQGFWWEKCSPKRGARRKL